MHSDTDSAAPPTTPAPDQQYRYTRTRSAPVFGLALLASLGALGLVWGAWSALDGATERNQIAAPPDLKGVVAMVESGGRDAVARARALGDDAPR